MNGSGRTLGGRYRLDERVGVGGMGEVWRSTDQVLERTVAVKIMHPALLEETGFSHRFRSEARAMATIDHPGVIPVYDYQSEDSGAFLVMSYVDGEPLSRLLHREGKQPAARTMELVAQAADALAAAHERGIVHRDVKPANLLLRRSGTLVLTDFGIARIQAGTQLTATGAVLGTPSYLTPEQVLGRPATPLSDVYALGIVAFEALTGQPPFLRDNTFASAMARVQEPPPALPEYVPAPVAAVVRRAMATEPADRWPSAAALADACRGALAEVTTPAPARPAAPTVTARAPVAATEVAAGPVPVPTLHAAPTQLAPDPARADPPVRAPAGSPARPRWLWAAAGVLAIVGIALIGSSELAYCSSDDPATTYVVGTQLATLAVAVLLLALRRPALAGLLAGVLAWEWYFLVGSVVSLRERSYWDQGLDTVLAGQVTGGLLLVGSMLLAVVGLVRCARLQPRRPRPYMALVAAVAALAVATALLALRALPNWALEFMLLGPQADALLFPLAVVAAGAGAAVIAGMVLVAPASLAARLLVVGWLLGGIHVSVIVSWGYDEAPKLGGLFYLLLAASAVTALVASLVLRPRPR